MTMLTLKTKKGFSLVEIVTVVAILGISIGIFYTVFFMNWESFESFIARADLSQELDEMVDKVVYDGRFAKQVNVNQSSNIKQAAFIDPDGKLLGVYTIKDTGEFVISRTGQNDYTASTRVDFTNSNFNRQGKSFLLTLALKDQVLGHPVTLSSATEIYPRN